MPAVFRWDQPVLNPNLTYTILEFISTVGEDGPYSQFQIQTNQNLTSDTDPNGQTGANAYFYYVQYQDNNGNIGPIILASVDPTIRELRLANEVTEVLPELVRSRIDTRQRQVRIALHRALDAANISSPTTGYTIDNMPQTHEIVVKLGAQIFIYCEQYLGIAIKDFSYSEGGIALNKDRGSKVSNAIDKVLNYYNQLLKQVKLGDWPSEPIGLGSLALSFPQQRIVGLLYGIS